MRTTTKKGNNKSVIVKNIKRKNNSYITFKKQNMYNQNVRKCRHPRPGCLKYMYSAPSVQQRKETIKA